MPAPLVDSPKCPRCSLVGICLPDETNWLHEIDGIDGTRVEEVEGVEETGELESGEPESGEPGSVSSGMSPPVSEFDGFDFGAHGVIERVAGCL